MNATRGQTLGIHVYKIQYLSAVNWVRLGKESSYGIIVGAQLEYFLLNLEIYRIIYDATIYEALVDSVLKNRTGLVILQRQQVL